LANVDFPEPLRPTIAVERPAWIDKFRLLYSGFVPSYEKAAVDNAERSGGRTRRLAGLPCCGCFRLASPQQIRDVKHAVGRAH
jgi:hypothetical protein